MKIIISDIFLRKSFDVYNIVKKHYKKSQIILASPKTSFLLQIKSNLIYGKPHVLLRKHNINLFLEDLLKISLIDKNETIVFLPVEEDTTELFLSLNKNNLIPENIKYLLPEFEMFKLSKNKYELQEYCESIGLSVPRKYTKYEALNLNPFRKLIVKPRLGSGSRGIRYINNKSELKLLESFNEDEIIIQERIKDSIHVIGAFFLCKEGEIIKSYCHKRIRTSPPSGGVTIYSEAIINREVLKKGAKLLKSMNWNGLVMIEFLQDSLDDKYKIIELNPRIWGSILLSEFVGSEMLKSYIELSVGKGNQLSQTNTYFHTNRYIRWVIPYDLKHFFVDLLKGQLKNKRTCYINFTYAGLFSAFLFLLFSVFSFANVSKLMSKFKR